MRIRLSASYTVWMKVLLTIMLFIVLLFTDVYGSLLRNLPDIGDTGEVLIKIPLFIFLCYKLIDFVLKERKVVEFDENCLYVFTKNNGVEYQIPLHNISKLNMRPMRFSIGSYSFHRYDLHYTSNTEITEKQSFYIRGGRDEIFRFIELVKRKNPNFISKTWTHSLDFIDKYV